MTEDPWPFDWSPPGSTTPPLSPLSPDPVRQFAEGIQQMCDVLQSAMLACAPAVEALARNLNEAMSAAARHHGLLVDAGVLPPLPASDPKERALQLRRTRNTGPEAPRLGRRP